MKVGKKKQWKLIKIWIAAGIFIVCFAVLLVTAGSFGETGTDLRPYVNIRMDGLNGSGKAVCQLDYEGAYRLVAGTEKNAVLLDKYRKTLESVAFLVEGENGRLSNGDKVKITMTYDETLGRECGLELVMKPCTYTVEQLPEGKRINIFAHIDVIVAGVSPEAYVNIQNKWEDDFLSKVTFSASKSTEIARGDKIVVTCTTLPEDFAANGYIPEGYTKEYLVEVADSYIDSFKEMDKKLLQDIWREIRETIVKETEDLSFRMLYRASGDSSLLYQYNKETVLSAQLEQVCYLKRKKETEGSSANYIYYIVHTEITNGTTTMPVYFAFEYTDASVDMAGQFHLTHSQAESRYICSDSYEAVYGQAVEQKLGSYELEKITEFVQNE